MTKKKPIKVQKTETVEEYLARGGEIQKLPPQEYEEQPNIIKPVHNTSQIMHITEGEHFFAEKQTRKKVSDEEKNKKGREKLSSAASKYFNK